MKLLSVFTPTYNRGEYLLRLYRSLLKQTKMQFEWIIVDDGSNDNTKTILNSILKENNPFPIIYLEQEHGGKHRAINKAVKIAKGEMFFIVDSDDYLTEDAVECVFLWASTIENKPSFCGISGERFIYTSNQPDYFTNSTSNILDTPFVDASYLDKSKAGVYGDQAEVFKTDILRKFPFPEFAGETFVTEAVCWNAMAEAGYLIRWYKRPIYMCKYLDDGLTKKGANEIVGHINNYKGFLHYIRQSKQVKTKYDFVLDFSEYEKTAEALNKDFSSRREELGMNEREYWLFKIVIRPFFLIIRKSKMLFKHFIK